MAFCMKCFENKKKKFWLSRYNTSTIKQHINTTHKGENVAASMVVPGNSVKAKEALKEFERVKMIKEKIETMNARYEATLYETFL